MGQADTLAARCCVKGCREQQICIWLASCSLRIGKRKKWFRLVEVNALRNVRIGFPLDVAECIHFDQSYRIPKEIFNYKKILSSNSVIIIIPSYVFLNKFNGNSLLVEEPSEMLEIRVRYSWENIVFSHCYSWNSYYLCYLKWICDI
jgi:hypothetical protein